MIVCYETANVLNSVLTNVTSAVSISSDNKKGRRKKIDISFTHLYQWP